MEVTRGRTDGSWSAPPRQPARSAGERVAPARQQRSRARRRPCAARSGGARASRRATSSIVHSPTPDARQVGRAQRGRLGDLGQHDGNAEHVGLELHQPGVGGGAAVDAQLASARRPQAASIAAHGVDRLVGDRLERRAGEVRARRCRASGRRSSRARTGPSAASPSPVSGGHEVDAVVGVERRRERLGLGGVARSRRARRAATARRRR